METIAEHLCKSAVVVYMKLYSTALQYTGAQDFGFLFLKRRVIILGSTSGVPCCNFPWWTLAINNLKPETKGYEMLFFASMDSLRSSQGI